MKIEFVKDEKLKEMAARNLKGRRFPDFLLDSRRAGLRNRLSLGPGGQDIQDILLRLLREKMSFIAESIPGGIVVASMGLGDGEKELVIVNELSRKGDVEFCGMDISNALLEAAMQKIGGVTPRKTAYLGFFDDFPKLRARLASPLLLCCLGNGFCTCDPGPFLSMVRENLGPQDYFLIDCHLSNGSESADMPPAGIQAGRSDGGAMPQPFPEFGLPQDSFGISSDVLPVLTPAGRAYRMKRTLHVRKDCEFSVDAGTLQLKKGEELELGATYKYTFSQVVALLKRSRFQISRLFISDDNENLIVLARPLEDGFLHYSVLAR